MLSASVLKVFKGQCNWFMSKDSSFQRCDAMSLGEWFPTFWWIMVSSSFRLLYLWKWRHHCPLEKVGAT